MEILLLLYLAHFLGDYPLQTNWIYTQKLKSWLGGTLHMLMLALALIICLAPFTYEPKILLMMTAILITHYFQDATKLFFNKTVKKQTIGYFADQASHLFFSTFFWFIFIRPLDNLQPCFGAKIYLDLRIIVFLIGLILITYFADVTRYIIRNDRHLIKKGFQRDWKFMLKNALSWSIGWILGWSLGNWKF